jgi:carbonic anhydrase
MPAVEHALVDLGVKHITICGKYDCVTLARALRGDAKDLSAVPRQERVLV